MQFLYNSQALPAFCRSCFQNAWNLLFAWGFQLLIVDAIFCHDIDTARVKQAFIRVYWETPIIVSLMQFLYNSQALAGFLQVLPLKIWRSIYRSGREFSHSNLDGENQIYQTTTPSVFTYFYNNLFRPSSWPRHKWEVLEKPKRFSCWSKQGWQLNTKRQKKP